MKITIGLTRTDREANYVPSMDGYRKGAAQDVVVLEVEAEPRYPEGEWQAVEVGEAYFTATNAPEEVVLASPLATAVYRALIAKLRAEHLTHRLSMSVGDTVQVDDGPVLVVKSFGFEEVA